MLWRCCQLDHIRKKKLKTFWGIDHSSNRPRAPPPVLFDSHHGGRQPAGVLLPEGWLCGTRRRRWKNYAQLDVAGPIPLTRTKGRDEGGDFCNVMEIIWNNYSWNFGSWSGRCLELSEFANRSVVWPDLHWMVNGGTMPSWPTTAKRCGCGGVWLYRAANNRRHFPESWSSCREVRFVCHAHPISWCGADWMHSRNNPPSFPAIQL